MEKKYKVYQWICIYPDDVEVMGENLSLDEAKKDIGKLLAVEITYNVITLSFETLFLIPLHIGLIKWELTVTDLT